MGAAAPVAATQPPPAAQAPALIQAPTTGPNSVFAQQQTNPQLLDLQRRVQELDANNRQLTSQVAQSQQQAEAYRERSELLSQQLQAATNQNRQLLAAAQQYASQAPTMTAQNLPSSFGQTQQAMRSQRGATLAASGSLAGASAAISSSALKIQGAQIVVDQGLTRIRIPADQLFSPGTATRNPAGDTILVQVADILRQRFPRQRVAIEGHTDNSPVSSAYGTAYQLASAQAQAVMDQLVRRSGIPMQQLFAAAHGPNRPLADNQTAAGRAENRRIEIVIHPETF